MDITAIGPTHSATTTLQDTKRAITRVGMSKPTKGMTVIKIIAAATTPTQIVTMTTKETTGGIRTSSQGEEITTNIGGMTIRDAHTESGTITSSRGLSQEKSLHRGPLSTRAKTSRGPKLNKGAKIKTLAISSTR